MSEALRSLWNRRSVVRAHPTVPQQLNCPHLQHLTDWPSLFVRAKIQRALQVAVKMVALNRNEASEWVARNGIPADVRETYPRRRCG